MADHIAYEATICEYDDTGCVTPYNCYYYAVEEAITTYETPGCLFTLGLSPDGVITQWDNTDIIFSVWANQTHLTLDNANVEFVINDLDAELYSTKSTTDYSVITFGNTLVVHINAGELLADSTMSYIATITTSDSSEYSMTGLLFVSESAVNICFKTDVNIFERPITIINAVQRDAIKEITERTTPMITCDNTPQIKPIPERTSDIIIIAPCGKRIGA